MTKADFEIGNQNIFEDLGLPIAEEHLVKAQLVYQIDIILMLVIAQYATVLTQFKDGGRTLELYPVGRQCRTGHGHRPDTGADVSK